MRLELARQSKWTFETSNSASLGVGFLAGEGGSVTLHEPDTGMPVKFYYGAMGAGYSVGIKLPKIGKIEVNWKGKTGGGTASSESLPSGGTVYMVDSFHGTELTRRDIGGACAFVEVVGGLIVGGSANAMLFGMNPAWVGAAMAAPAALSGRFFDQAALSATGILLWAGVNAGVQGGGGGAAYLGMMYEGAIKPGRGWRK
jgi:hypothetical protein